MPRCLLLERTAVCWAPARAEAAKVRFLSRNSYPLLRCKCVFKAPPFVSKQVPEMLRHGSEPSCSQIQYKRRAARGWSRFHRRVRARKRTVPHAHSVPPISLPFLGLPQLTLTIAFSPGLSPWPPDMVNIFLLHE